MSVVHDRLLVKEKSETCRAAEVWSREEDQARRVSRRFTGAASQMVNEIKDIGFLYSGWVQAALPHRGLALDAIWQADTDWVSLMVEPGRRRRSDGEVEWVGVPYGSRARLILLYLQTEALRTQSREVTFGPSLNAWLARLEIPVGGKSYRDVKEQAERISRCHLTFHLHGGGRTGLINQNIVDTAMFVHDAENIQQGGLFPETARLSKSFYDQLRRHPLPVEQTAIKALANNSMALDLYCWLAYRLHALEAPCDVSWKALHSQFGLGFKRLDNFRMRMTNSLMLALAVYPAAEVEIVSGGLNRVYFGNRSFSSSGSRWSLTQRRSATV
jgi:hypothetical protein